MCSLSVEVGRMVGAYTLKETQLPENTGPQACKANASLTEPSQI